MIIRSRYAEDALADAVGCGIRQYVLIGAGFDSFIVRQPTFARDIDIFEIDHPASQDMKRQRLAACGTHVPPNVHFVAADLSHEALGSVLARCEFSPTTPAFFSWLGVTIYLTREANVATLRGFATSATTGSEIVFTYVDARALESRRSATLEKMRAGLATLGEPWISGFDPTTLATELKDIGLVLVEDLGSAQLKDRYCAARTDRLSPGLIGHVVRAQVP